MFGKKNEKLPDLELFTIYDSKSQTYSNPAMSLNKNVLIRELINMFRDPSQAKNQYLTNAEDYSVFRIAQFDKLSGQISPCNLEHVANLHDLRAIATPENNQTGIGPT